MQQTASPEKKLPPYLSYRTFQAFIEGLKGDIPSRIDRSVLSTLSGANQSWLLGALRFLDLTTDDGKPTDRLRRLAEAQGPDRQKRLQEVARGGYPSLFGEGFHLGTATPRQLEEAFANLGPTGDTIRRCVTFFVGLAKDADLPLSQHIRRASRATRSPKRRRQYGQAPPIVNQGDVTIDGSRMTSNQPSWNELLISKFPTFDPAWSDDMKTKWFDGFSRLMGKGNPE